MAPDESVRDEFEKLRRRVEQLEGASSERARLQEELERSELRHRSLYNHTPVMMHSINTDGRLVSVNDHWLRTLGYGRDEVLGRPAIDFLTEESRRYARDVAIPELFRTGFVRDVEYQMVKKDGQVIDVVLAASVERDASGQVLHSLAFILDVTDRKRAEAAARRSESRFRQLMEHAADAFFVVDPESRIVDVNARACESLGYSREELLGMSVPEIDIEVTPERASGILAQIAPGAAITIQGTHRRKDGSTFPVEVRVGAFTEDDGKYRIALARDVSERRRMERELKKSEERYRELFENAPLAYNMIGPDGCIRMVNSYTEKLVGYSQAELIGRKVFDICAPTPSGVERAKAVFKRFLAGEEPRDEEIELQRSDGSSIWVSLTARAIRDAAGNVVEGRSMLLDITERKRVQQALRESEERFAGIFRSAMDAIVIVDARREIALFNEAAEKVFDCKAEAAVGGPLDRFISEEFREVLNECLESFAQGGESHRYLWAPEGLTAIRCDGQEFSVEATVSLAEIGGEELCILIMRDVEDRKRAEAEIRELRREMVYLQEELETAHQFEEIVGSSAEMREVFAAIDKVAETESTVLIEGETGTGKELVARAIHRASGRRDRMLVTVNCAALPGSLIESELFGHEKGAFTGAHNRKLGRFELADGGTIFLDEIGDLPHDLQAKLLRVLQEGEIERVGGAETIKVDVRVIAATNRDLETAMGEGRFRPDLFYRLNVFPISVPPLRERLDDIPLLVRHFVMKYATRTGKTFETVPQATMRKLRSYGWPGNVRELENVIERAVILSAGPELELGDWIPVARDGDGSAPFPTLDELQRQHIEYVMEMTGWRVRGERGAAEILGLKPTTLEARMKKLGIERP